MVSTLLPSPIAFISSDAPGSIGKSVSSSGLSSYSSAKYMTRAGS